MQSNEVATAAGVTYRVLDYWARQGYVRCADRPIGAGSGVARSWTADEVAICVLVGRLVRAGFRVEDAAELARDPEVGQVLIGLGESLLTSLSQPLDKP